MALGPVEWESRVSVYRSDVDDMIVWFPDHRFIWSPDNFPVSRRGLEVETSVAFPLLGRVHSLRAHSAWSRVEHRGSVLSGQLAYRPRFTADLQGNFDLSFGAATVHLGHVGTRRSVAGTGLNALDPYTLLDLGLELPFSARFLQGQLQLHFSNLLDEKAALLVDYPLPGRGWTTSVSFFAPSAKDLLP
mgnify:CR=1 FL=1